MLVWSSGGGEGVFGQGGGLQQCVAPGVLAQGEVVPAEVELFTNGGHGLHQGHEHGLVLRGEVLKVV